MRLSELKERIKIDKRDVIVAGGGLAGSLAAVAAAREGMNVLLIEKYGFLGGMAASALITPFMTYFESGESGKLANKGLFEVLRNKLAGVGAICKPECVCGQNINGDLLKLALDRLLKEYGVTVLLHSLIGDVDFSAGRVKSVTVSTVSGNINVKADYFIDATGNADLTAFAGLEYNIGRESDGLCQPMTTCFRLCNVDWEKYNKNAAKTLELYKKFQAEKKIKNPREDILTFGFVGYPSDGVMHFNTTRIVGKDPTNVIDRTAGETEAREQIYEMYRFLKENVEGMENAVLINAGAEMGIRESRRIIGHYELSRDDLVSVRKFGDSIARGTYEIDIHNPAGTGTHHERIPDNDYYTIPYRSLVPQNADNLIVAGRPICSTHEAHAAIRIMPITSCIGEAAGIAAALAVKGKKAAIDVPVGELRTLLKSHGALI
ncbi:MAG: FAD-dependent oxidoreductase [Clostridiales bacterium]|jgi:hypothetical protein|nr:FAD-dependent oxidoreductase [Clostridiales bacterium]